MQLIGPYDSQIHIALRDVLIDVRARLHHHVELHEDVIKLRSFEASRRYQYSEGLLAEAMGGIMSGEKYGPYKKTKTQEADALSLTMHAMEIAQRMQDRLPDATSLDLSLRASLLLSDSILEKLEIWVTAPYMKSMHQEILTNKKVALVSNVYLIEKFSVASWELNVFFHP